MSLISVGQTAVCLCSGRAVVLDEPSNRYLLLGGTLEASIKQSLMARRDSDGALQLSSDIVLPKNLANRRLVAPNITVPTNSLIEDGPEIRPSIPSLILVGYYLTSALVTHKTVAFSATLTRLRHRRDRAKLQGQSRELSNSALCRAAATFYAARRAIPIRPVCLQDSIALLDYLGSRGLYPRLVIGVRLNPFAAHCWVQTSDLLLNETADTAGAFQPIQVI